MERGMLSVLGRVGDETAAALDAAVNDYARATAHTATADSIARLGPSIGVAAVERATAERDAAARHLAGLVLEAVVGSPEPVAAGS